MTAVAFALAGAVFGLLGSLLLYVASPQQRLLGRPWPARRGWLPGTLALAVALAALLQVMGSGTAVFVLLTVVMTALTALPFLALLRRRDAGGPRR